MKLPISFKLFSASLFITSLFPLFSFAQELKVQSMEIKPLDITARTNPRADSDGNLCALLKIYVTDNITKVQGNIVGDVVDNGVEKWVYVPDHTKQIQLNFQNHFPLMITFDDYNYHTVSERMTYVIKIVDAKSDSSVPTNSQPTSPVAEHPTTQPSSSFLEEGIKAYKAKDYARALELFTIIEGDSEAQYYLGMMYWLGRGVKENHKTAEKWLKKSAAQNNTRACYQIGLMYAHKDNYKEGFEWFKKGSELGDGECSAAAANWLKEDKVRPYNTKENYKDALSYYIKSAEQGYNASYGLDSLARKTDKIYPETSRKAKEALKIYYNK